MSLEAAALTAAPNHSSGSSRRSSGPRWRSRCLAMRPEPRGGGHRLQGRVIDRTWDRWTMSLCAQLCTPVNDLLVSLLPDPASVGPKRLFVYTFVCLCTQSAACLSLFDAGSGAPGAPCRHSPRSLGPVSQRLRHGANDGPAGTEGLCGVTPAVTSVCPGGWWHY